MEHYQHSSISNSGNLIMQSSPFASGIVDDDVQGPSKKLSSSSSSSSSLDSPLDDPFGAEDKESGNKNSEHHTMQTSPPNDGVDFQALSKRSQSSSSASSLDKEGLGDDSVGSMQMQPSLDVDEVDDQGLSKLSRSSSLSSSSSADSLFEGNFGFDDDPRYKDSMQFLPMSSFEKDYAESLRQASRASTIYSSPKASLTSSYKNADFAHLMMQSSLSVEKVDVQSSRKISRSSSSSSSTNSPLNSPSGKGNEETGNTSIGNSALTQPQAPSKTSRSSSSSSSSDSPREDPTGDKPVTSATALPDGPVSRNSPPRNELPMSTTDSPPTQVMERTTKPKYRIPSRVFTRDKSNNPVDWSVASNESLFSIHMGNMSFTREQLNLPGESSIASGPIVNHSANPSTTPGPGLILNNSSDQSPGNKATNGGSQESGKAEAAVETMEKARKENESGKNSTEEGEIHHHPAESAASNKSFAFPILTDGEKRPSISTNGSSISGTEQ